MPGKLESNFGNTANLIARIDFGVKRLHFVQSARRAKIDPTKKLAHNDQIDATNTITSQRRAINERFENSDWPQVRVIAQELAKIEQAVFTLLSRRQVIVLGITDSAEKDRRRFQAKISGSLR